VTVDEILHCVAHWATVEDARQWCEALRLGPRDAWSWRHEFSDIKDAQRWHSWADLDTAALWSKHRWNGEEFWECDRAADWATSGVADPNVASTWRKKNFAPDDAVTWLTCKVDADFAQECASQGLDHGQFQRLASEHPAWDPDQIAWKWSLVRAGLECDNEDGVPGIHLEKGRPDDALTRISEVIAMALENGVDRFVVYHGAKNLRLDLLEFVDDPVFVRGAGRAALEHVSDLDPELCVRSVEHDDAGRSTVVLERLTVRPQFFSAGKGEQELAA